MRIVALVAFGFVCFSADGLADDPPKPEAGKAYAFSGRLEAQVVDIRPRVSGLVTRIAAKGGEMVVTGDVLLELDSRLQKIDLDTAKGKLARAETLLRSVDAKLERAKKLVASAAITKDELAAIEVEREVAKADVFIANADVARAETILSYTRITAPAAGRLGQIKTVEGNFVRADDDIIVSLVRTDTLAVAFDVDERTLLRIRRQMSQGSKLAIAVGFVNDEGYPHKAEFRLADPAIDLKTGTVRFVATLPNAKAELIPGQSARVRVTLEPGK